MSKEVISAVRTYVTTCGVCYAKFKYGYADTFLTLSDIVSRLMDDDACRHVRCPVCRSVTVAEMLVCERISTDDSNKPVEGQ